MTRLEKLGLVIMLLSSVLIYWITASQYDPGGFVSMILIFLFGGIMFVFAPE